MSAPVVARRPRALVVAAALPLLVVACWAAVRGLEATSLFSGGPTASVWLWAPVAALLAGQTVLYACERPHRADALGQQALDRLRVAVLMPVYNEDPAYLRAALTALAAQTRRPEAVHLVDDGSDVDYTEIQDWWTRHAHETGVHTSWQRTPNQGKRRAQATALEHADQADIIITVDSDAMLAVNALDEVLQPFADPRVQGAAGLVVAANHRATWLTRLTDLYFVANQLVDRSALSPLGAVMVAPGSLAAYRAPILRDHLPTYLGEKFLGRPVQFSDDSLLTLFALLKGRVVQQPTAVVFTAMPERTGHHLRQYLRWMRGSTIRSLWRARHLPLTHPAYLAQLLRWFLQLLCTGALVWLAAVHLRHGTAPSPWLLTVPLAIGYAQALRYLTLRRSDETPAHQAVTWLLTPLALAWGWTVLRAVRWYGTLTCGRTRWGTRTTGPEVTLATP
ncbi:glycosyltransferase [Streptomyces sp. NBC_00690]|uniref:glycosyltransferase n=1 Tax=Streptomyces sp. NBC_00690 TaxID=2975808 RepID=UPI002E2A3520|nr:glycosyltransferase [Streptomyces sp. NBC_00690]